MLNRHRSSVRIAVLAVVAAGALLLAGCSQDTGDRSGHAAARPGRDARPGDSAAWTWKDATGTTITLDHRPDRIVVLDDLAVSMLHYGVRPAAVFGRTPMRSDPRFDGLDTEGITDLSTTSGDVDPDALAAEHPDLVITSVFPESDGEDRPASGFASVAQQGRVERTVPVAQVSWSGDGTDVMADVAHLAASLGAPERTIDTAERRFDTAAEALRTAAEGSDVEFTAMYADADGVYVAKASADPALRMYRDLGLDVADPDVDGSYWAAYSWPNARTVPGDVLLVAPQGYQQDELAEQPTFVRQPALAAGQVHPWPSAGLDYVAQAAYLQELVGWLATSTKVS